MKVGSLFSGIGGLDLGLERAGMEIVWQVENDDWCSRVLARHWPDVTRFQNVRDCHGAVADAAPMCGTAIKRPEPHGDVPCDGCLSPVDLICGGFPCQPVSHAGRRMGESDSRWLWPEFHRIICEVRPRWVLAENVPGLLSMDSGRLFGGILRDLAEAGYDAVWFVLSAADVGAPHLRERVFIVAHAHGGRHDGDGRQAAPFEDSDEPQDGILGAAGAMAHADAERCGRGQDDEGAAQAGGDGAEAGCVADARERDGRTRRSGRPEHDGEGLRESERAHEGMADAEGNAVGAGLCTERAGGFGRRRLSDGDWWTTEPDVGRVAHGVPARVDRLRGLGNAVVPQVAEMIGRWIMDGQR